MLTGMYTCARVIGGTAYQEFGTVVKIVKSYIAKKRTSETKICAFLNGVPHPKYQTHASLAIELILHSSI